MADARAARVNNCFVRISGRLRCAVEINCCTRESLYRRAGLLSATLWRRLLILLVANKSDLGHVQALRIRQHARDGRVVRQAIRP